MLKIRQPKKTQGFTLIELLVVIAIIGILAALLFPGIQSALVRARAAARGQELRSVFIGIFDKTLFGEDSWPDDTFTTSTEYFSHVLTNGTISGVDFRIFSAPGLPAYASLTDWEASGGDGNAWSVTIGLNNESPSSVPFIFTRNFNLGGDLASLDEDEPLDRESKVFGDKAGVVITKGGSVVVYTPENLTQEQFNPPDPIDPSDTRNLEYIEPE